MATVFHCILKKCPFYYFILIFFIFDCAFRQHVDLNCTSHVVSLDTVTVIELYDGISVKKNVL